MLGGAAYSAFGVLAIAIGATLIALAPIPLMLATGASPPSPEGQAAAAAICSSAGVRLPALSASR